MLIITEGLGLYKEALKDYETAIENIDNLKKYYWFD